MFAQLHARVERVLAVVAGTALFVMMVLTFVDVIGRYGFNASVFGASEMIEVLMTVTIFAGVAFVSASNEHITVTLFEAPFRRLVPGLHRWGILMFGVVVYAVMIRELWVHTGESLASGKRTAVLDLPQWILPGLAALLSTVGLILLAGAILKTGGRPERLSQGHGVRGGEPGGELGGGL